MNRLLIFIASVTIAIATISTTCLANPAAMAGATTRSGLTGVHPGGSSSGQMPLAMVQTTGVNPQAL
ncbi:hypothetical protein [Sphingomonas sp.]|uniref:hypothetical protein n=1 Tax=Sphingomonas sp. TaxID=28214 RepID=UPI0025DB1063|nr:hypothetical protein [Sphingomonas sp.]MBV9526910.1 hypothetical protein [Sphingomonas sp.]